MDDAQPLPESCSPSPKTPSSSPKRPSPEKIHNVAINSTNSKKETDSSYSSIDFIDDPFEINFCEEYNVEIITPYLSPSKNKPKRKIS